MFLFLVWGSLRVSLQFKLALYIKGSLIGYLCITVCTFPHRHSSSFHATPFSSIIFRAHSFRSVIFLGSKYQAIFLYGAVRPTTSQCVHTVVPPVIVPLLAGCVPLFFKAFTCLDKRLISCCCLETVSTDIAILAASSARGPPFDTDCVAAAEILSKYSSCESII